MAADLLSQENLVLLNPRLPRFYIDWLRNEPPAQGNVYLLTSGTNATDDMQRKWVVLPKSAILAGAQALNLVVTATNNDVWGNCLPKFHIGGLAIDFRAADSAARVAVYDEPWSPPRFQEFLAYEGVTLTSLVPTQLFDLVTAGLRAPSSLRVVFVGGGTTSQELKSQAVALGWPVRRTYGMTETASQVALENETGAFRILPHCEVSSDSDQRLLIRGTSLLSAYIRADGQRINPLDPDGWFRTEDLGRVDGEILHLTGRAQDRIKVLGELVNLAQLRQHLLKFTSDSDAVLLPLPDARRETRLVLASTVPAETIVEDFNATVAPFERIQQVVRVDAIPVTELHKIRYGELINTVSRTIETS